MSENELIERLRKAAELIDGLEVGRDCEEYSFARGTHFQAMTYNEDAFRALLALPDAADRLEAQAVEIERLTVDGIHTCHDQCARPACVLRRENTRLREALTEILGPLNVCSDNPHVSDEVCLPVDMTMGDLRRARQALQQGQNNE